MAEIEENLKNFIKEVTKNKGYADGRIELKAISSGGANYTSALYLATASAPPQEDLHLFAKVANVGKEIRAASNDAFGLVYETERYFYTVIAVAFEKLYNKNGVPEKNRLYIPKFYGFKPNEMEEILVLENLAAKGYGNFDRFNTFNWEYASKSIEELAKFHALGLAYREENPEELGIIVKNSLDALVSDMPEKFINQAVKTGTQVKEEYRDRIKLFIENNNMVDLLHTFMTSKSGGFLIHGDYKPSNLMHRRRGGKVEVVPLDYQTYRLEAMAADLMYFIYSGSDAHFRKHHYEQLLEHYYKELTRALQDLHLDINKVYPRKVFENELEQAKYFGLFIALIFLPLMTVESENAPKFNGFDDLFVSPNQLTMDRINDIVADYIRLGIV